MSIETAVGDGCLGRRASLAPTWSKLADAVLAMVRLKVSLRDCVRMAAVCRSWRSLASEPVIPLLLLSPHCAETGKRVYCPEDGGFLDFKALREAWCRRILGSHDGGWIAVGGYTVLTVINVFLDAEVKIPVNPELEFGIDKVVFSEPPTSSGCILAAITADRFNIALCRASQRDGIWTITPRLGLVDLTDIVFCRGELYGLYDDKYERSPSFATKEITILKLFKFDIGVNKSGAPVVTARHQLAELFIPSRIREKVCCSYMVDLRGKPSIAVVARWLPSQELFFKVFELVDSDDGGYRWAEVMSLGGYALFVSPMCSKAVEVGGHMQGNAVYHSSDQRYLGSGKLLAGDPEGVQSIVSVGTGQGRTPFHSTWVRRPAELLVSDLRARFM